MSLPFDFQNISWGLEGLREAINIHPLFVHFPIALLLSSLAAYGLGSFFKKENLFVAGKWMLYLGTVSAAVTVWTGLEAAETVPHGGGTHDTLMAHQYLGYAILGLSLILSAWVFFSKSNFPRRGRALFLIGLGLLALLLIQGGDLGGRMVFLHGVGVGRKSMVQKTSTPSPVPPGHGTHEHGEHSH